jgi:peptide/nickel transport system permease protein
MNAGMSSRALWNPTAPGARVALSRWRRSRPAARVAAVGLGLLVVGAVFAPILAPYDRDAVHLESTNLGPTGAHPFGTDDLGRDTLTRVLHGGRVSLAVAALSTLVAVGFGALLGLVAGYRGGWLDALVLHAVDVALSIPMFFVLLLLGAWFGGRVTTLCLVIGLTSWMPVTRLVRAATQSLRQRTFVEAARALGFGTPRILWRHVLPLAAAPMLVAAGQASAQAILIEAALGYLGFGLQPPTPSWGTMLQEAQAHVFDAPWAAVFPGLAILATMLALNVLTDAWRDALDPRLAAGGRARS